MFPEANAAISLGGDVYIRLVFLALYCLSSFFWMLDCFLVTITELVLNPVFYLDHLIAVVSV